MARPIGETPVLYGEDAVRFLNEMENVKPASNEEKERVRKAYEMMKEIATFKMQNILLNVSIIEITLMTKQIQDFDTPLDLGVIYASIDNEGFSEHTL